MEQVVKLEGSKDSTRYVVYISYLASEEEPYIVSIPGDYHVSLQTPNPADIAYKLRELGLSATDARNIQSLTAEYMQLAEAN